MTAWHIRIGRFPLCTMGECPGSFATLAEVQRAVVKMQQQGSTNARVCEGRCPCDPETEEMRT